MQTFLPYPSYDETAKCLDRKRLGKQRVEAFQILKILTGNAVRHKNGTIPWENHPAVKMWRGHEFHLWLYTEAVCEVWVGYGYRDSIRVKCEDLMEGKGYPNVIPFWLGWSTFHDAHKSALLRKNPEHYGRFNWSIKSNLPYIWPERE